MMKPLKGIRVLEVSIGERGWLAEVVGDEPRVGDKYERLPRLEERVERLENREAARKAYQTCTCCQIPDCDRAEACLKAWWDGEG